MFTQIALVLTFICGTTAGATGLLDQYPETKDGKRRVVIDLPKLSSNEHKVELIISKFLPNSDCNGKVLKGEIKSALIEEYYPYYDVQANGGYTGTMKACSETKPETIYGRSSLVIDVKKHRPLVIYIPEAVDVEYRVLKAEGPYQKATSPEPVNGMLCERFYEQCRALFCTGGYRLKRGQEVVKDFRFFDHQDEALAVCEAARLK